MHPVSSTAPARSRSDLLAHLLTAVLLLAGVALRVWVARRGYHNDEIGMFDPAGIPSILFNTELSANPPLLQLAAALLPPASTLWIGRLASTVVGCAGLAMSCHVAARLGGPWAATATAAALSLNVAHLTDTTTFRAYAWLCLVAPWFLLRVADLSVAPAARAARVVEVALLGALLGWLHYVTLPFVLLAFAGVLWRHRSWGTALALSLAVASWAPFPYWMVLYPMARQPTEGLLALARALSLDVGAGRQITPGTVAVVVASAVAGWVSWRDGRARVVVGGALVALGALGALGTVILVRSPIVAVLAALWIPAVCGAPARTWVVRGVLRLAPLLVVLPPAWDRREDIVAGGPWLGSTRQLDAPARIREHLDDLRAAVGSACVYAQDQMVIDLVRYPEDARLSDRVDQCGDCRALACATVRGVRLAWSPEPLPEAAWQLWDPRFDRPAPDAAAGCTEVLRVDLAPGGGGPGAPSPWDGFLLSRCAAGQPERPGRR